MAKSPKILISLLNWCNYQDTINCVYSLLKLDYPNFEISIVDNASPNDSEIRLRNEFSNLKIIKSEENLGFAGGHKLNLEINQGNDFHAMWILNNDLIVSENALSELIKAWKNSGDQIYGSVSLNADNPEIVDFGGGVNPAAARNEFIYNQYKGVPYKDLPPERTREVQTVEGSSFLLPLSIVAQHGFLATDFFMYAEETDYCYRLRKEGVKTYLVRDSLVLHKNEGSFKYAGNLNWIKAYYRRRNFMRFMMDHFNWTPKQVLNRYYSKYECHLFRLKWMISKSFRERNFEAYWYLKGTIDAANGIKGRTIDPNNYVRF